jgi:hypothetical protein
VTTTHRTEDDWPTAFEQCLARPGPRIEHGGEIDEVATERVMVGGPAHAAIIGDPGATHPTSSPSRPDRRLSPRMTPPRGAAEAATRPGRAH